jgi:hypothetical protein
MKTRWMLVTAACLGTALAAEVEVGPTKEMVQVTKTEHFDFAPGGTIHIGGAQGGSHGDLNIIGWEKPEVEVTVIKSSKRLYTEKESDDVRKRLDLIAVKVERKSASDLTITTSLPHRSLHRPNRGLSDVLLEYQIHIPMDSRLVVRHGTGTAVMSNVTGDVDAHVSTGDIVLLVPSPDEYAIDAKSKFGGVESDFGGTSRHHHMVAHQLGFAPPATKHKIYLRVGIGTINIKADRTKGK